MTLPTIHPTPEPSAPAPQATPRRLSGSRRRRIWELSMHAHCPVIGVCLPIGVVRRLVDKVLGGRAQASDYELHCGVNTECKQRNPVAEAVQRELDQRYQLAIRQAQGLKTTEALAAWWRERSCSGEALPATLWTTLTHPRCDALLEETVLQDVHMLQHQSGAADRADLARLNALLDENQVLSRELAAAQQRSTRLTEDHARQVERLQAELMRSRADLIGRDTVVASLWDELRRLEAEAPDLRSRSELSRRLAVQIERSQDLERSLMRTRHELERERLRADEAQAALQQRHHGLAANTAEPEADLSTLREVLVEQSVLCVGGRPGVVPVYRQLLEQVGARFLHHDGGEEDHIARLDHTLAAADLVICQTGCVSHDAYWRVKDHCKRTGKRCLFVDNPSGAGLKRALIALRPVESLDEPPQARD